MKMSFLMMLTVIVLLLGGCTYKGQTTTQLAANFINKQSVIPVTEDSYPSKNPKKIAFYSPKEKPLTPYRIIALVKISKYNLLGNYRQNHTLNTMMRNLAASLGGDGLININHSPQHVQAQVIQYQKILI